MLFVLLGLGATRAHALDLDPEKIRGNTEAKPVSVLQNRYFEKALRPEIGLLGGTVINESYTDTTYYGGRFALFLNEWVGVDLQAVKTQVVDSDDRRALNTLQYPDPQDPLRTVSPDPAINPIRATQDLTLVVAPFYGKMNLMDQMIVYSDVYLSLGAASVTTDQGRYNALVWGAGQRFYLFQSLSLRLDVRDRIFVEKRLGRDSRRHSFAIDFGVSMFVF